MLFPNGRYDDQVDSTARALVCAKPQPTGRGMLDFYRRFGGAAE
jgi:hypothetical protein